MMDELNLRYDIDMDHTRNYLKQYWREQNERLTKRITRFKSKGNIMKSDKSILDEMASETRANINAELLVMIELAIAALSEITPLDKTLLNRIDRLKEKADELRDETK